VTPGVRQLVAVSEAEFFERFDRHLVRGNAAIERGNAVIERNAIAFERNAIAFERMEREMELSRKAHEDLRSFIRDTTLRNERVWRGVMDRLDDMGQEIRAQTDGLLKVLDRLEGAT
jgi:hypothetical protein